MTINTRRRTVPLIRLLATSQLPPNLKNLSNYFSDTMKLSIIAFAAVFAALVAAAPVTEPAELVARQCTCTKVGDEWICRGRLCQG
ncbi:hypothetical protein CDEST_11361 [Colletotrichum destructivum]|uniref:Uncharacterized protein n=1 Tax=Colletotrichum destructivum TaxID=34406 RepID=A0AAX4IT13_9PEZI|nr:hypothetical protein CDEST_11361 [Colletotrichum destructivum]